jgi:hypothetical protein
VDGRGVGEVEAPQRGDHDLHQPAAGSGERGVVQRVERHGRVSPRVGEDVRAVGVQQRRHRVATAAPDDRGGELLGHLLEHPHAEQHP